MTAAGPFAPRAVAVTGGAGFIGLHMVRAVLARWPAAQVEVWDAITYAGDREAVEDLCAASAGRLSLIVLDIADQGAVSGAVQRFRPDLVLHLAAESHVDRSLEDPLRFITSNVHGTGVLLWALQRLRGSLPGLRFHHVSTDEVFGSLPPGGFFDERSPYDPSSPYSASKAASDHLVRAWGRSFGVHVTISNCSNNYGPGQFPEKLIPLVVAKALRGEAIPVYGDGLQVRDWIHVHDHVEGAIRVAEAAPAGSTYLLGGGAQPANLELVRMICAILDRARPDPAGPRERLITHVADRPGHDRRYAIDPSAARRDLGWAPRITLQDGLSATIDWYLGNQEWCDRIRSRGYAGQRLGLLR